MDLTNLYKKVLNKFPQTTLESLNNLNAEKHQKNFTIEYDKHMFHDVAIKWRDPGPGPYSDWDIP